MIKNPKYLRISREYRMAIKDKENAKKVLEELKSKLKTLRHELEIIKSHKSLSSCFIDEKKQHHISPAKIT
jgi:hypothetical protein